ncbi:hypothetical protein M885DRAFT_509651 [Pelagophyceae sp. CCMP2097]|nr:hypothetical protein M885DRAFT_509651 [Pelagophyceae sp. CCMP2097]|mmetsp:Transcript_9797/g.32276  ORF Transcript_9797/g.32276 Transcript_9797/m.32276 type:complete len:119 (+) Transcript_9797:107-463(+)
MFTTLTLLLAVGTGALAPAPKAVAVRAQPQFKPLAAMTAALGPLLAALPALADEDGYEYGAVAAPGWVLPAGAVAVIFTALIVPLALKSGDDAQREMADRDVDSFGKENDNLEQKRKE